MQKIGVIFSWSRDPSFPRPKERSMIFPFFAALLTAMASAQWTKVNQPTGVLVDEAIKLSTGSWVASDTNRNWTEGDTTTRTWISANLGATWSAFRDENNYSPEIFGSGIVVDRNENDSCWHLIYDAPTSTWAAMRFDRKIATNDTATFVGSAQMDGDSGAYDIILYFSDSLLAFHSSDSARTWTSIAAAPTSDVPGDAMEHSEIAAGWLWLEDTVSHVLSGTRDGRNWVSLASPSGFLKTAIFDTLSGGGWIVLVRDSSDHTSAKSTTDSGKTWSDYDISTPDALPSLGVDLSNGWRLGLAIVSDMTHFYARQGSTGSWYLLPVITGDSRGGFFVDNGLIYGTGDSGLVSLDLGVLGVRKRSSGTSMPLSWRMEGSEIVVSSAINTTGWEIRDLAGRSLATGKNRGASELRIPTGDRRGLLLVRLEGAETRTFPVPAP